MKLKIRSIDWSTGLPVAVIHKEDAIKMGVHPKDRVVIRNPETHIKVSTVIDVSSDMFKEGEIVVSDELKEQLELKEKQLVDVHFSPSSNGYAFIKEKLQGKELSKEKIAEIIKGVNTNSLSEAETTVFVSAMYMRGMTFKETIYLIEAILASGSVLKINKKYVVDKHCIGGIAGNRTTPLVVAICAATGLIFPKSSSRSITSAAGTADTIEVLAKVDFPINKVQKIIDHVGACLVWGGGLSIAPADAKIIQIEKALMIDPKAQLLASIMSKKLAADSNYILIDIPFGEGAKVSKKDGLKLKDSFEKIGKAFNKTMRVVLTEGKEPIGNGVGPVLEIRDVIKVLKNEADAPEDLLEKALFLSGQIFEMTGKSKKGEGIKFAREVLASGKAYLKFKEIIEAQGGKVFMPNPGKFSKTILAEKDCKVIFMDNKKVNSLARVAGCPTEKSAGVYLNVHVGTKLKKGEPILTIYAESSTKLERAEEYWKEDVPILLK